MVIVHKSTAGQNWQDIKDRPVLTRATFSHVAPEFHINFLFHAKLIILPDVSY